jgi:hypothetical protein
MPTATQKVWPTPADPSASNGVTRRSHPDDNRLDTLRSLLTPLVG